MAENYGVNYTSDLNNYPKYDEDDLDDPLPYEFKVGDDTTLKYNDNYTNNHNTTKLYHNEINNTILN
jgi:hypothetical protein